MLWLLLVPLAAVGQVETCFDFESSPLNGRPAGWGAVPNLDFNYMGVLYNDQTAHTGNRSLRSTTECFALMPGMGGGHDGVWMLFWYNLSNNTVSLDVGYLTDETDTSSFHPLATLYGIYGTSYSQSARWYHAAVDLSAVPAGARVAFHSHDMLNVGVGNGVYHIDDIHLTSTPCAAWDLRVAENRADSVRLEWQSAGSPTVTLTIDGNAQSVTGNSHSFARDAASGYTASLIAQCPVTGCMPIQPFSEATVFPYREGACLDASDFNSTMALPGYGPVSDPYLYTGTYTNPSIPGYNTYSTGSHALNTSPFETGNGLMVFRRILPPGDTATLRLGNRAGDWESASMLYTLDVDTNEGGILVMKYSVAMDCGHMAGTPAVEYADSLYPAWFRIELMDDTLGPLPPSGCNLFHITCRDTAGWDEVNSMYKRIDFTGRAFDLRPYHGRRLKLRVTATDGAVNNRWCYGYYNFACIKGSDAVENCDADSATFTAPWGFLYRWYCDGSTATADTAQSITVPLDGTLWHCDLVNRHNPDCVVTIDRHALSQPTVSVRDTVVENALPHTFMGVAFAGDADTSFVLPSVDGCDTLLRYSLHVWPNRQMRIERRFCVGTWPVEWEGYTFAGPDSVRFTLADSHGADSTVTLVALEAPNYEVYDTLYLCPGMPYEYDGIDYGGPATVDVPLLSVDGCDSLLHLSLLPRDSAFALRVFHSTDLVNWYDTLPLRLCANQTLHLVDSTHGSDSWQWRLSAFDTVVYSQLAHFPMRPIDSILFTELTLHTVSAAGCEDSLRWKVEVYPAPVADFSWDPSTPVDIAPDIQLLNLSATLSLSPSATHTYTWYIQNGEDTDTLTDFEPRYRFPGDLPTGDRDIMLVDSLQHFVLSYLVTQPLVSHTCVDTARRTVTIATSLLQFPNLVTPNGDGVNDRWRIVNLLEYGLYSMNELWIYSRWGNLVYHVRDIHDESQFWDPSDPFCPDGTYFFRFSAKSLHGLIRLNGTIEVVR